MGSRGLGRGFASLIPTDSFDAQYDPTAKEDSKTSSLEELSLTDIEPDPDQPRRTFDDKELASLSESIQAMGVIQPIVVIKNGRKYQIVAGERRWRAAKLAGLEKIPAVVRTMTAQNRLEASLIENVQREDLNAIETRAMIDYKLKEGQMRPLISATPEEIKEVLPYIINEGWSARKVEQYMVTVRERAKKAAEGKDADDTDSDEIRIESEKRAEKISARLGVKVRVHTSSRGTGRITLNFKDEREFERLCTILTS